MQDTTICEKVLRIDSKDVFIDLKSNRIGVYVKISERKDGKRSSIMIPVSEMKRLLETLKDAASALIAPVTATVTGLKDSSAHHRHQQQIVKQNNFTS